MSDAERADDDQHRNTIQEHAEASNFRSEICWAPAEMKFNWETVLN